MAIRSLLRTAVLGVASGVLAGVSSYLFLEALDRVTQARREHGWLVLLLPLAGLAMGLVHQRWGGRAVRGNALLLEEVHTPSAWVPRRMAPLVFAGTVVSHLFGASVGREGTALQLSGSLTDALSRALRLAPHERRLLLVASLAGGFGAVFGVPLAGVAFALEVQAIGPARLRALVPAVVASFVGNAVVGLLGHHHTARPTLHLGLDAGVLGRVAVIGVACGLTATAFATAVHLLKRHLPAVVRWAPARPLVGGLATLLLVALVGRDELGLSLPLIDGTLAGIDPPSAAFALKLVFTAIAIGCGFPGGEVTPLFVMGTTLGGALAGPLGMGVAAAGSLGFVAVFAGAAGTPVACTVMAGELFGAGALVPAALVCVVAYVCSGPHGIYATRRRHAVKLHRLLRP